MLTTYTERKNFIEKYLALSELTMLETQDNSMRMLAFPIEIDGEGAVGALVKMEGFKAGGNSTIVYFGSKNCAMEEGRVKGAGGKII